MCLSNATCAATLRGHLSFRERMFVAIAWMPKATVQAALAGLPYDAALAAFGKDSVEAERASVLLALGVLAIVVTAPLGAAAVAVSGEKLLTRTTTTTNTTTAVTEKEMS
jgi:NhaP-type Na+/H+ or K+/H+ antiporter